MLGDTLVRVGQIVGDRYRLDAVLDEGGMGILYAATHTMTRRPLVVKFLKANLAGNKKALQRFFQEARAAAALAHPNVVDVLDLGEHDDGAAYIVLEKLEGESLQERLDRVGGTMPPGEVLDIIIPILDALGAAHERNIIHRDLKPGNIFIAHDSRGRMIPKLLDFGTAKLLEREGESVPHTRPGSVLGTLHYMPPEHLTEESEVGPKYDIWSIGVVLYRCLSGRLPFMAERTQTLLMMIVTTDPHPLELLVPELPQALLKVVARAMSRSRDERYASAAALCRALLEAADEAGIAVSPTARLSVIPED